MASRDAHAREAWGCMLRLFLAPETHDAFHTACTEIALPHPGSLKALLQLDAADPPSMREMAEAMHCDASYVTALVDALEDVGYVERRVSPMDRRVKLVHLTAEGKHARARALEVMGDPPKGMESLTAAETRTLAKLLAKVASDAPTVT